MKKAEIWKIRLTVLVAAVLCAVVALTGCNGNGNSAVVTPVGEEGPTTTFTTRETVPIPKGQMTMHDMLVISGYKENLTWEDVAPYNHTDTDESTGTFDVMDEYGGSYSLVVVHQENTVSSAILSKGDSSIDIRTGSVAAFWREVLMANQAAQ